MVGVVQNAALPDAITNFFGPCNDISLPSFDFVAPDVSFLEDFEYVITEVKDWVSDLMAEIVDEAGYLKCCDPFLGGLADFASDIAGLITCTVDGAISGVLAETLDLILPKIEQYISGPYNELGNELNALVVHECVHDN